MSNKAQVGDLVKSLVDYEGARKGYSYKVKDRMYSDTGVHILEVEEGTCLYDYEYTIIDPASFSSEVDNMEDEGSLEEERERLSGYDTHPTGARRENKEGKGDQHLLFVGFPYTLTELAKHMENPLGRNWEKGLPVSSYANAAIRHLMGFLSGDPEPHHLRAAIWNMMCMSETVHRVEIGNLPEEVDDVERDQRSKMNGEDSNVDN